MKIFIPELNKTFTNKAELFKELKANESKLIAIKKAAIYESKSKGQFAPFELMKDAVSQKGQPFPMKSTAVYPVINTINYYDSHGDVHRPGIWSKSVNEQDGKLFYVMDHELKTTSIIAWPSDVKPMVKVVSWAFLGKNYAGTTEALVYEIEMDKIVNPIAKEIIEQKRPIQNSVRMQYVKLRLGINSNDKEYAENKLYFDSVYPEIVNKEAVDEAGYLWGIEEAKIIKEGSMVPFGSNDATPITYPESVDDNSDNPDPATANQVDYSKLVKHNFFNY
jgi:hypothetical protein